MDGAVACRLRRYDSGSSDATRPRQQLRDRIHPGGSNLKSSQT